MRELLFSVTKKDLQITYYSGTGAGGQYRNRHKNCVRIRHPESGVIVTGQEQRNLNQNLKMAFKRLSTHEKFRKWIKIKASEISGDKIRLQEKVKVEVEKMVEEKNLKIEYFDPDEEKV